MRTMIPGSLFKWATRIAQSRVIVSLGLAALVLVTFWPVLGCGFLGLDDPRYVTANPHVQAGLTWEGLRWAFTAFDCSNWHPVTWMSHILDVELFGKSAQGPHFVNLALHALNTLLLFGLLQRLTSAHWRSALVAALFAVHPLRVESVAWISERKDVLSAMLGLLALLAYARYARTTRLQDHRVQDQGGDNAPTASTEHGTVNAKDGPAVPCSRFEGRSSEFDSRFIWHGASLLFFALGLMAKPMLVTLPFVLLLLDYWPLGRFADVSHGTARQPKTAKGRSSMAKGPFAIAQEILRKLTQLGPLRYKNLWGNLGLLAKEKSWFFLLAAASCVVTIFAQKQAGAVQTLANYPATGRVENALISYVRYVGKTFCPVNLAMPYPLPEHWRAVAVASAAALVALWIWATVRLRRELPFLAVGSFWFLGMLVPVIGLVQAGGQAMADRYTYLPQIGLWVLVVWGAGHFALRWRLPAFVPISGGLLALSCCAVLTRNQIRYWNDTEALLRHTIAVTEANCLAWYDLGACFDGQGRVDEAIGNYERALEIYPDFIRAHNSLADDLAGQGKTDEALFHYAEVCRLDPKFALAHNNYGAALARQGHYEEAIEAYTKALQLEPDYAEVHYNLALILATQHRFGEAVPHYEVAARMQPKGLTYNNLGYALAALGRDAEALGAYRKAVALDPKLPEAYVNLGNSLARSNDLPAALDNYYKALGLNSNNSAILNNLGHALARENRYAEAITDYQAALRLDPDFALARFNLASALMAQGQPKLAAEQYRLLVAADKTNPRLHYELARALGAAGQPEEAADEAANALRLKPTYLEARQLARQLAGAKQ